MLTYQHLYRAAVDDNKFAGNVYFDFLRTSSQPFKAICSHKKRIFWGSFNIGLVVSQYFCDLGAYTNQKLTSFWEKESKSEERERAKEKEKNIHSGHLRSACSSRTNKK